MTRLADRLLVWLDKHKRTEDRIAVVFLLGVAAYVGGHVAIHVF